MEMVHWYILCKNKAKNAGGGQSQPKIFCKSSSIILLQVVLEFFLFWMCLKIRSPKISFLPSKSNYTCSVEFIRGL